MTPRNRRRLGVLVGIALLVPLLGAASAASSPIDDKKAAAARLQQQLDQQDQRIEALDEQYNQAQLGMQSSQAALAKARADSDAANARFATVRARMSDAAVNAYMQGGNTRMLDELIRGSGNDLALRQQYVKTAAADDTQALDTLRAARQDLDTERAKLQQRQSDAKNAADKVASDRAAVQKAVGSEQALLSQVKGELATLLAQQQAAEQAAARARIASELASRQAPAIKPARNGPPPPTGPPPPVGKGAGAAIAAARSQIGKPYQWGAAGPDSYDCSGLVMWAWAHGGVSLSHSTYAQWDETTHVAPSAMQPGDILFFGSDLHHNALYAGGGTMIEAPHTGAFVREVPLRTADLYGVGRVSG